MFRLFEVVAADEGGAATADKVIPSGRQQLHAVLNLAGEVSVYDRQCHGWTWLELEGLPAAQAENSQSFPSAHRHSPLPLSITFRRGTCRCDVPVSAKPGAVEPGLIQHIDHPVVGGGGGE